MPSPPGTFPQRRRLLLESVERFANTLTDCDAASPVPGLDWTVAELGAHLVALPRLYREMAERPDPLPLPDDMHRYSAEQVAAVGTRDLDQLAELISTEVSALLDLYGDDPAAQFNHWVTTQPLSVIESTLFNEFLIHGWDLGGVAGSRQPINRAEAIVALDGILPVSVNFFDPVAAGDLNAVVHLRLRGGHGLDPVDWTQTIANGAMTVTKGRPARADVRLNVDPATFLLLSLGRIGELKPTLTGKVVAYGRKPWLAPRLSTVFHSV